MTTSAHPPRKQRSDGARSRATILEASARLATVEGLRGLSIGGLAEHIGMSKSGLYAHFTSKEALQLATIATAAEIFDEQIVRPAMVADDPLTRIRLLCEGFLVHVESDTFPGGCFFAAASAEVDTHPGQVRERIAAFQAQWMRRLVSEIEQAQAEGSIRADENPAQLGFELTSMLSLANTIYVLFGDRTAFTRSRAGIDNRLALAAPPA